MKEFLIRTLSALGLIALVVGITLLPDAGFFIIASIFLSLAAWEMGGLIAGRNGFRFLALVNFLILMFSLKFHIFLYGFLVVIILTGLYSLFTTGKEDVEGFFRDVSSALIPPFILAPTLFHIYLIWSKDKYQLYLIIFIISIADTAAYLFGTKFGKHKIFPAASPKKSWEGFVAALIFGAVAAIPGILRGFSCSHMLIVGFITSLFAQLSDPFESLFKRAAGVKDSSNLIPGHGGVLDRIDSYIYAAPVFYYLFLLIGK